MQRKFKSFGDALTAAPAETPVAANDNKKPRKNPEPRYRGTLPALRWLYDNHPELAEPVAEAVRSLSSTTWSADAIDNDQEIRPTIGEIVKAGTDEDSGEWLEPKIENDADGNTSVHAGTLKFVGGKLVEYGQTKKGRKLQPRERITARGGESGSDRNPDLYVFRTGAALPSPLHTESYQRPFSGEPALSPMYDPQNGVEAARAELQALGIDGSVAFANLPFPAISAEPAIANGAEFMGGIVQSSGTASSGALMWEAPEVKMGDARKVIEEVAAGMSLNDIGERLGYGGSKYAVEKGKEALKDAAIAIIAANDNKSRKSKRAA